MSVIHVVFRLLQQVKMHAAGRARSAIVLPSWFCEELDAGDVCRGILLFYPRIGM
jgi:hypothetical protein